MGIYNKKPSPIYIDSADSYFDPDQYGEMVFDWSLEVLIHIGKIIGMSMNTHSINDITTKFSYLVGYGTFKVAVSIASKRDWQYAAVDDLQLLDRDQLFSTLDTSIIERVIARIVPQLDMANSVSKRACQMTGCASFDYAPRWHERNKRDASAPQSVEHTSYRSWALGYNARLFNGLWICEDCRNRYSLMDSNHTPSQTEDETSAQKTERAKMTPSLRFEILVRDNFRCRACGRDPRRDDIALHVDHIVPIAKGGKTEPDNLQALCSECNLAKSARRIEQMELWTTGYKAAQIIQKSGD